MPKFKVTFEVLDDFGTVVVEKQQTFVDLSQDELAGPDLSEATKLHIERMAAGSSDDKQEYRAANMIREHFEGMGLLVGRFIEVRLREWAKAQR